MSYSLYLKPTWRTRALKTSLVWNSKLVLVLNLVLVVQSEGPYCLRGCEASYPQSVFQAIFPELIGTTSQTIRSIRAPVDSLSRLSKQLTSSAARWSLVRIHRDLQWLSGLCLAYVWSDWLLSAQYWVNLVSVFSTIITKLCYAREWELFLSLGFSSWLGKILLFLVKLTLLHWASLCSRLYFLLFVSLWKGLVGLGLASTLFAGPQSSKQGFSWIPSVLGSDCSWLGTIFPRLFFYWWVYLEAKKTSFCT